MNDTENAVIDFAEKHKGFDSMGEQFNLLVGFVDEYGFGLQLREYLGVVGESLGDAPLPPLTVKNVITISSDIEVRVGMTFDEIGEQCAHALDHCGFEPIFVLGSDNKVYLFSSEVDCSEANPSVAKEEIEEILGDFTPTEVRELGLFSEEEIAKFEMGNWLAEE
jgi:hypothetical protein